MINLRPSSQAAKMRDKKPVRLAMADHKETKRLFSEITLLAEKFGAQSSDFNQATLKLLTAHWQAYRAVCEANLNAGQGGLKVTHQLCQGFDQLVYLAYRIATELCFPLDNPTEGESISLVAVGGYGRGIMAPFSDVDILFLLPYKHTGWTESIVETILYLLWDLKLKLGHSVRSIDEAMNWAKRDQTVQTTLVETRFLAGNTDLFHTLNKRFEEERGRHSASRFVESKLDEREERHARTGQSRYQVEPNVKESKGGLRDLQSLFWITGYLYPGSSMNDLIERQLLSANEAKTFRRAEGFLLWVRCQMHFITGRAEERLSFELQQQVAERAHYTSKSGLSAVERFMRRYFIVARDVGHLTLTIIAALELREVKKPSGMALLLNKGKRRALARFSDFSLFLGRIMPNDMDGFSQDPKAFMEIFWIAQNTGHSIHPEALKAIRNGLKMLRKPVRQDPDINQRFLVILSHKDNPEPVLRLMNETGFLGAFIPSFATIVAMMQFNMYHHYTVDEHLLLTVDLLAQIEHNKLKDDHPLSVQLIKTIKHRRALYVAAFIHDIAKGRPEDHSIAGSEVALGLCPRLGLKAAETETVAWLVRHHLLMSDIAQRRDLSDPKTIRDFADIVQSVERLNLLLLLTVCDIRAVGPGVWNGWKGQLLRTLYFETEPLLSGGFAFVSDKSNQASFAAKMDVEGWDQLAIEHYISRHYTPYWRRVTLEKQVAQAGLIMAYDLSPDRLHSAVNSDAFQDMTEVVFVTASHNRLLSMIAGACAAVGASIVDAHIFTTRDGVAINSITLNRERRSDHDEKTRTNRLIAMLDKALSGQLYLSEKVQNQEKVQPYYKAKAHPVSFLFEPEVSLNNNYSDTFSVIEVRGLDRTGLLYDLTRAFNGLSVRLASAQITTYGEQVVDVFYVTDLMGKKIIDKAKRNAIEGALMKVLK